MPKCVSLEGECVHGVTTKCLVPLPLTVEVIDVPDDKDGSEWIVWLTSRTPQGKPWYVVTACEPTICKPSAETTAAAFRALLSTPEGETQVIEYVKHRWEE
jgi:hypothetical protein